MTLENRTVAELDRWVREGKYLNRSRALQATVNLLAEHRAQNRLARELAKLDRREERQMAEEDIGDVKSTGRSRIGPTRSTCF